MMGENLTVKFLQEVDRILPREWNGMVVSTDRVLVPTVQDAAVLQFYVVDDKNCEFTGCVTASGKEIRFWENDIAGLAQRRVNAAMAGLERR